MIGLIGLMLVVAPWNPFIYIPEGQAYDQHIAEGQSIIADVRAYAMTHCGEPYMPRCDGW